MRRTISSYCTYNLTEYYYEIWAQIWCKYVDEKRRLIIIDILRVFHEASSSQKSSFKIIVIEYYM